jgi:hypothetical protein
MSNGFLSKRVKKRPQSGITSERYEFLGLDQAEPDLGDPYVGPSSVSANPYTGNVQDLYFVASSGEGKRYWTKQTDIISGGVVTPGSITVRDKGSIVGGINQVTDINFVGSGVTVISPASFVGSGSSSVDIQISVTDVSASGNDGSIQYKGSSGFIEGSDELYFDSVNNRVGIGTNLPTEKLEVIGNTNVSGILSANTLVANKFTVNNFVVNDTVVQFVVTSDSVGIGTTIPTSTLDVRGTTNISGVATAAILSTPQLVAENADITGILTSNSYRVGTDEVISSTRVLKNISGLDAVTTKTIENAIVAAPNTFDDLNVTGISTLDSLGVIGLTTTKYLKVSGLATVFSLDSETSISASSFSITGVSTVGSATTGVTIDPQGSITATDRISSGFSTSNNAWVSGIATITTVDTDTLFVERVEATKIGIGTTNPQSNLDVIGDIRFSGAIYASNGSGTPGQVLLSDGINAVSWGNPASISAGSATSVTINDTSSGDYYYPTFVSEVSGNQSIRIDSNNLIYSPSTGNLGIGSTQPKVSLDVVGSTNVLGDANITGILTVGNINVQGITRFNSNTTTTTLAGVPFIVDSLDTNTFRSSRYTIQVSNYGKLLAENQSVTNISGGKNYSPGVYENVNLISKTGIGTNAKATITIQPEATLGITSSYEGLFTTSHSLSGIDSGQTLYFNKTVFVSDRDDSILTELSLNNSGIGYTEFPNLTIDSPIINGNPVEGVGIGSTAEAIVDSLKVSNVVLNSGLNSVKSTIPTISFTPPVGSGTSAIGLVGFGLSTITVNSTGNGYYSIPTVIVSGTGSAEVSGTFVTDVDITNVGSGYTVADFPVAITVGPPAVGVNTATVVQSSFSIANQFTISSAGAGYTAVPVLTVDSPAIGVNTATVAATLGISTFIIGAGGSGYVYTPTLNLSQTPTGFSGKVGLGISDYLILSDGGSGYTSAPTITIDGENGIGTGAQIAFTSINPDSPNNLADLVIVNPGYGYTVPPTITISGGGGTGAAVTIRTMTVTDVEIFEDGFGLTSVPNASISPYTTKFTDFVVSYQGVIGIADTTILSSIVISNQGTLSTGSTTIISGISTFNTLVYTKTGDLSEPNDFSITGINTSNIRVGQGVTGSNVSAGTTVIATLSSGGGTVLISQGTTNGAPVISNTFYFIDTTIESVQVGQGVTGTFISAGSTVVSIGSSAVEISNATFNSGIHTDTYYFGPIETVLGIGNTTIITGISTNSVVVGQGVTGSFIPSDTLVNGIGSSTVSLSKSTTNTGITTQIFYFNNITDVTTSGTSLIPSLGIGGVSVVGYGTGYLNLPGIAVTSNDGVTGGGGIVTTTSFSINDGCVSVANSGSGYTNSIPTILFNPPGGGGTTATAVIGVGITGIDVTNTGSYTSSKPSITFSGGSGGTGLAATVTDIFITGVTISNAGFGYTSADLPLVPTFNDVGFAASTGFGIYSVSLTKSGIGYTVIPSVTITPGPTLGLTTSAEIIPTLGYGASSDLAPGPGYGGVQVYYIQPVDNSSFRISTNSNGSGLITLGFSTSNSPSAFVGGEVNSVSITNPGSGYLQGEVVEFLDSNFDIAFDTNVGIGFSFVVGSTYSNFQTSDLLLLQTAGSATTNAHLIEYGTVASDDNLGEYSADISGSDARLKFIPTYSINEIKIYRTSITN